MIRTILFIGLLAVLFSLRFVIAATPQQVTPRSIVSEYFTKNRPGANKRTKSARKGIYRLASKPLPSGTSEKLQIGVTIWKLQRSNAAYSNPGESQWIARRVEADTRFREGDVLRLSIESPRFGYLYVIDRDWFTDGSSGEIKLIFPTRGEDNRLQAGKLIDIPGENRLPFKATPASNQSGELLTIIVTSAPLSLPLSEDSLPVSSQQLEEWEDSFGCQSERFELIGGAGQVRSIEEQLAASSRGARQLTRYDPGPQTIYFLAPRSSEGFLFNLMLSYDS